MGSECSMHGVEDRSIQAFYVEKLKERVHLYERDVDGMRNLKLVFTKRYRAVELKYLVLDRYRSRAVVKAVMNLRAS